MARAKNPPTFSCDIPGPWGVDTIGKVWHVIHGRTLAAKAIGRVGGKGINYFERALAEAARRNIELRAKERKEKPAEVAKPYTVVVGRPDYCVQGNALQETFHAHVTAVSVEAAQIAACKEAAAADFNDGHEDDYIIVAVYEGHLQDLNTTR